MKYFLYLFVLWLLMPVNAMAATCPKIGGNAVYTARVLYGVYRDTLYDDEAACAAMSVSWRLAPGAAQPQTTFSLQPNPADEIVFLNISQELKNEAKLEVLDLLGRVVEGQTYPVRAAGAWPLNTEELRPAVYYVRITDSNGSVLHTDKLVIVR